MEKTDNELIAEFMGLPLYKDEVKFTGSTQKVPFQKWQYHTSWDWLMPVVEKIKSLKGSHFIYDHSTVEIFMWGKRVVKEGNGHTIDNFHRAVVEFIKWYNQQ